jgi:pyrroloquinoline quinone biosynthesis protein B
VCRLYWDGDPRVQRRTQSSVAISSNGHEWVLLNCSPDIREQIGRLPPLQPKRLRGSPIGAVIVTNGDIDHVGGLLSLREGTPFHLLGTGAVLGTIEENPIFAVLDGAGVTKTVFAPDETFSPLPGLIVEAFTVPGKVPLYMEGDTPNTELQSEFTVGLDIKDDAGHRLHYIPGCSKLTPEIRKRIEGSDLIFFDGTLWHDDEMIAEGLSQKTGRRMGHMPVSGEGSSLAAFKTIEARRKVYIHINNTNPILVRGTPEEAAVRAAGWDIAEDGMEIEL